MLKKILAINTFYEKHDEEATAGPAHTVRSGEEDNGKTSLAKDNDSSSQANVYHDAR